MLTAQVFGPATSRLLLFIAAGLLVSTIYREWQVRKLPALGDAERVATVDSRRRSVRTWWLLFAVLVAVLALGAPAVAPTMAMVSFLLLRETLELTARPSWLPWASAASAVLLCVLWLVAAPRWISVLGVAAVSGLVLLAGWELVRRWSGETRLETCRARLLAIAIGVTGPVYSLAVARLPASEQRPDETLGWFLLFVLLTVIFDMSQAWSGRLFGRRWFGDRGLAPRLSPHKTWEGLFGGFVVTIGAAVVLGPMLTSFGHAAGLPHPPWLASAGLGLLLGTTGIAGDLSGSWLKRRVGVKDSGRSLPGHGGFLDRFDSLWLTAPTFYAVCWLLWFRS